MVAGNAVIVKTITSKEERGAIDAEKDSKLMTLSGNQIIW